MEKSITDYLLEYALEHKKPYEVKIGDLELTVYPKVFPPVSPFNYDSTPLLESNDTKKGEIVLDIGTGSGVHAIVSGLKGAEKVIATDISQYAIDNCLYNSEKHGLGEIIQARKGNLFEPITQYGKSMGFDLIIANLPFVDHPADKFYEHWVYDPDYKTHKQFFSEVGGHLKNNGRILIAFSDIGNVDFFESQVYSNGLNIKHKQVTNKRDQEWIVYKLTR